MSSHRLQWHELPLAVRAETESFLGARVVSSVSGPGGFSPSFASRCDLDDGRTVFVKAVSHEQNPESPNMLRREMEIAQWLPAEVAAPRLLHALDDGAWVVGVFEYVSGRPPHDPWEPEELDRVLAAIDALGAVPLTPALERLPSAASRLAHDFVGWRRLAEAGAAATLDEWTRDHLTELVELESGWMAGVVGDALVHLDIRADNIVVTPDGSVVFVDWAWACRGARGIDRLAMLPSVTLEGGGEPEDVLARRVVRVPIAAAAIDSFVAALAGTFTWAATLPDPPGLPTVRAFQRAQGTVALRWLRTRLGDPPPQ